MAGKHGKRPRCAVVAPERFREARLTCFLSVDAAAKLLHVTPRTVHNWETGAHVIPYAAYKLMRIMRGFELPGDAWKGWRLNWNEVLVSPEGHRFRPEEFDWLHLLIEQAKYWRRHRAEVAARKLADAEFGQAIDLSRLLGQALMAAPIADEPNPYTQPFAGLPAPAGATRAWRYRDAHGTAFTYQGVPL